MNVIIKSSLSLISGKQTRCRVWQLIFLLICGSANVAFAATFDYVHIAGAAFHAINKDVHIAYDSSGCIYRTGGTDNRVIHKVVLPDRAEVKYLRLYARDTASTSIKAFLTTYSGTGGINEITDVPSKNNHSTNLSAPLSYLVDNQSESINVVVRLGATFNGTLQFCGVRIAYYAPEEVIFQDSFE